VWFQPSWIVRTSGPVEGLTGQMQRALASADPNLPFSGFFNMRDLLAKTLAIQRVEVALLSAMTALALLLSAVGIFALIANIVTQKTREIGIRLALGSSIRKAMIDIGRAGVGASALGLVLGLVLCSGALRAMRSVLYGVEVYDVPTILAVVLMLTGGLDLARTLDSSQSSAEFTDVAGLQMAAWVRENTSPRAIFLVAPDHNQPVPTLGGRRVVVGYGGWLWTYGLSDWTARTDDARRMLSGDPATPALLRRYHVNYVVVGPAEINVFGARPAYWDGEGRRVYTNGSYTVYRVG